MDEGPESVETMTQERTHIREVRETNAMTALECNKRRPLGEGMSGIVWEYREAGRKLAMKQTTVMSEIAILKRLSHTNILPLVGIGPIKMHPCEPVTCVGLISPVFVPLTKFIGSDDWVEVLESGAIISSLIEGLLSALCYLHDAGVCHYDVKTDNVLLDKVGKRLILCDFGMAKAHPMRDSSLLAGSLESRAPEVLLGGMVSAKVDVWGFGVTVFELCFGTRMFDPVSTFGALQQIFSLFGTPSEETWPGVSRYPFMTDEMPQYKGTWINNSGKFLCEIVTKSLTLCPEKRPSSKELFLLLTKRRSIFEGSDAAFEPPLGGSVIMRSQEADVEFLVMCRMMSADPRTFFHAKTLCRMSDITDKERERGAIALSANYYNHQDSCGLMGDAKSFREAMWRVADEVSFDLAFAVLPDRIWALGGVAYDEKVMQLAVTYAFVVELDRRFVEYKTDEKAILSIYWAARENGHPFKLKRHCEGGFYKEVLQDFHLIDKVLAVLALPTPRSMKYPKAVLNEHYYSKVYRCREYEYMHICLGHPQGKITQLLDSADIRELELSVDDNWEHYCLCPSDGNVIPLRRLL